MAETKAQRDKMAQRKKVQGAISATTATLGLAALGTKGGAAGLRQAAKHPKMAGYALIPKAAYHMDKATIPILTTGAGIGGVGGFNFAAIQREEARRERENFRRAPVAKAEKKTLSPKEKREKRIYQAGYGVLGAAALPATAHWNGSDAGLDDIGEHLSRTIRRKAQARPAEAPRAPKYEYRGGTKEQNTKVNNVQAKADHPNTGEHERATYGGKAEELRAKYGIRRVVTDPGHAGREAREAPFGWRAARAAFGTPKKATAGLVGGLAAAGGAYGVGMGTWAAHTKRKRDRKIQRKIDDAVNAKTSVAKSAFGVVEKVYDPEASRHRRTKAYQTATAAGAVTTAAAGGGLLALKAAPSAKQKANTYARQASKAGNKERAATFRSLSRKAGKVEQFGNKIPHKGKIGAGLVGASAALSVANNRIKAHRNGAGRTYTDWWDG